MRKNKGWNKLKEIFIFVFLLTLILLRFLPMTENTTIIKLIGYIGVLVALVDLYYDANEIYGEEDKFNVIRGLFCVITILSAILLALLFMNKISINNMWSDIFTLLALLISLPKKLYLNCIKNYIIKWKE